MSVPPFRPTKMTVYYLSQITTVLVAGRGYIKWRGCIRNLSPHQIGTVFTVYIRDFPFPVDIVLEHRPYRPAAQPAGGTVLASSTAVERTAYDLLALFPRRIPDQYAFHMLLRSSLLYNPRRIYSSVSLLIASLFFCRNKQCWSAPIDYRLWADTVMRVVFLIKSYPISALFHFIYLEKRHCVWYNSQWKN